MNSILRIDLSAKRSVKEELPEKYQLLGGRGLSSRIIADEVPPHCDPLGKYNKLALTCGLLAGTGASSASRVSVGTKSPLTGGIKEASGGGLTAYNLARLGYRALILQGTARSKPQIIIVDENGATFEDAGELWGLGTFAAMEKLGARFGKSTAYALIGPAGEFRMNLAGIAHTDIDGRPTRYSARGGVGAVMGGMGVKAIVVRGVIGAHTYAKDEQLWKDGVKRYTKAVMAHPVTGDLMPKFGTSTTMDQMHGLGAAAVHNFRRGQLDDLENTLSGRRMRDVILERGGEGSTTHACMPGCIVRCSNIFPDEQGKEINSPMEYETMGFLGSNICLFDFDSVNRLNHICNDLGVDTIETGGVLAVAAEEGLTEFGNFEGLEKLLGEIAGGTPLGRLMGLGAAGFARAYGSARYVAPKGQTIGAYDPRTIKTNGVTYLTSPMGGDHTAGNGLFLQIDHPDPKGKVQESYKCQVVSGWVDTLGLCTFLRTAHAADPSALFDALKARYGGEWTQERLDEMGRETLRTEISFNRRAGISDVSYYGDFLSDEPLPPLGTVWKIDEEELENIWAPLFSKEEAGV